eukprot:TRINITY_DN30902_c0_g1_i1.p1 TRINITY_DN30902_c0_g1~~TRINITY_DN30902_c0_g1_i1.p1  ORF type:complete len:533 (-),score=98.53 TRINITY_DN30902_c0_g1_i1:95-1639(-)
MVPRAAKPSAEFPRLLARLALAAAWILGSVHRLDAASAGLRGRAQLLQQPPTQPTNLLGTQDDAGSAAAAKALPWTSGAPYKGGKGILEKSSPAGPFGARPRLFFLFLVYYKISNEDIWDRFFARAVQGVEYRAFVLCKSEADCRRNIKSQHRFEIIPSVETKYCTDLVSGMNALFRAALASSTIGSPNDKFILLSDTTLPVKPFHIVQRRLTVDAGAGSDFCIFPRSQWAEVLRSVPGHPRQPTMKQVAVKHHQWFVLSRAHAKLALDKDSEFRNLMTEFQLNQQPGYQNTGCLDEFWHFTSIFPGLDLGHPGVKNVQALNGGPLVTSSADIQGQCDTYLHWTPRNSGVDNNLTRLSNLLIADPGTEVGPMDETRPSSISRLSKVSLKAFRDSYFLFARKVDDDCPFSGCGSLSEAFENLVFSDPPREILGSSPTWLGQGVWLDNLGQRVTASSSEGFVQLSWTTSGTTAKGSYCSDRISMTFSNGYKASASLAAGGDRLHWSNGVIWHRAHI